MGGETGGSVVSSRRQGWLEEWPEMGCMALGSEVTGGRGVGEQEDDRGISGVLRESQGGASLEKEVGFIEMGRYAGR